MSEKCYYGRNIMVLKNNINIFLSCAFFRKPFLSPENNEVVYQTIPVGIFFETFTENYSEDDLEDINQVGAASDAVSVKNEGVEAEERSQHTAGETLHFLI